VLILIPTMVITIVVLNLGEGKLVEGGIAPKYLKYMALKEVRVYNCKNNKNNFINLRGVIPREG
jgi:hypothetical protein